MEEFKPTPCTICLAVESRENCRVIEETTKGVLDTLLLKLPIEVNISVICMVCYTKVFEAFRFKAICTDTEDSIFPYVHSNNGAPVDLKEIYLKETSNEQLTGISEDERICRLCMQLVTSGFTSVRDLETDLICKYIPEVNFNSTEEPIVCTVCLESLKTHGGFLRNCLGVQMFENICEDRASEGQFDIKTEEIHIKCEEANNDRETLPPAEEPAVSAIKGKNGVKTVFKAEKYKCSTCAYQAVSKQKLTRHQLKHKDMSEVPTHNCDICSYKTKYKGGLVRHMLVHKDISDVQMYTCDTCRYKTKYRADLVKHQLIHKDVSEIQFYKCNKCDYKTKRKDGLISHALVHKDVSEVQMYKCDMCSYKTKYKADLIKHRLVTKTFQRCNSTTVEHPIRNYT